jgi:sugar/nucleoside kinase (ribokinase family)
VVVVGAASRDLTEADPRGWRLGGGVCYGALTVARLGLATGALVGVDEQAATSWELDLLREAGVDVRTVDLPSGPVFENVERAEGREQICHEVASAMSSARLPQTWRAAAAWILAPVAAELGDDWAGLPPDGATVAVGSQGLIRQMTPGARVEPKPLARSDLVRRADIVGVSRDDLSGRPELVYLTSRLHPGATLALTDGPHGGVVMEVAEAGPTRMRAYRAIEVDDIVDPTGAGDVFLAALTAARVEPRLVGGRIGQGYDLLLAAAAASLVVERPGLLGVPGREEIRRRMARGLERQTAGRGESPASTR